MTKGESGPLLVSHYNTRFDLCEHFIENQTPICGYAIPRGSLYALKLTFDELLPVNEDWDFLVRAALHLRVHDTGRTTSVYRTWRGEHNSTTAHPKAIWTEAVARIHSKLAAIPLVLPPGSATILIKLQQSNRQHRETMRTLAAANEQIVLIRSAFE